MGWARWEWPRWVWDCSSLEAARNSRNSVSAVHRSAQRRPRPAVVPGGACVLQQTRGRTQDCGSWETPRPAEMLSLFNKRALVPVSRLPCIRAQPSQPSPAPGREQGEGDAAELRDEHD